MMGCADAGNAVGRSDEPIDSQYRQGRACDTNHRKIRRQIEPKVL